MEYHRDSRPHTHEAGKNGRNITLDSDNDDDDFVKMPPVIVRVAVQKNVEKQTRVAIPGKVEDSLRLLNTRFPPEHLTNTMAFLNKEQQNCVQSIGFGSALKMQLQKLPRTICYWVVDNYDPITNSLRIRDQRLVVTKVIVHKIYGIPMGDIPMSNPLKANSKNRVVQLWKSQFPKSVKRIRLTHVVDLLRKDTKAGPFFILNFLVLFVSVMIEYPSMGTVNQGFLENLGDDVDIKQLDWCEFVVSCLKSSRMMWKRLDDNCVYTGPIVFLLLFIQFTKVEGATIERPTTRLIHWTTKMLEDRELEELSKGGFGNVTISSQQTDMNHDEQDGEDDDAAAAGSKRDGISPDVFTEHVVAEKVFAETSETYENSFNSLEEIVGEINLTFDVYHDAMKAIDKLLVEGIKKFPESEELRMLVTKRDYEFNMLFPDLSDSNDYQDGTFSNGGATPVVHGQSNTTETKDDTFQEVTMEDDANNDIVFSTPFNQILDAEAFDMMLDSTLATKSDQSKHQNSSHSHHHASDIKIDDENAVPVSMAEPRRTKRIVQLTDKFRSPYFNRVVDPNKRIKSKEERVAGWIFAGLDNEWDLVFDTKFGERGHRGIFESMIPGSKIHATIIDIWATILNHQERHRNRKSPSRMFVSCTLLSNFVLDEAICIEKRYNMFVERMNGHLEKYKDLTKFTDVDLIFFPVLESEHYYLIVFDFKRSNCIIIDNIYSEEPLEVKYGNVPNDLKILFTLYTDDMNHPKKKSIKRSNPMSLSMEWRTKKNFIYCGVFLMRHMETYKGQALEKWDVGLEHEFPDNDDQQMQLDEMRKKYVAKILTSDLNVLKPALYKMLPSYDKLSDLEKESFNTEEHLRRIERRISLFY